MVSFVNMLALISLLTLKMVKAIVYQLLSTNVIQWIPKTLEAQVKVQIIFSVPTANDL